MIKRTSDGLRDLLIRHGVTPTMDSKKDIELARQFMPKGYNMSNWISVDDELPKSEYRKVIIWCHGMYWPDYMHVGVYISGKWNTGDSRVNGVTGKVTHWMPLPEPPK